MPHWSSTEKGKRLVKAAFEIAGLPEVAEAELEPGTYTNQQIVEMTESPKRLIALLMGLPDNDPAFKRSILSFAVEMDRDKNIDKTLFV